MCTILMIWLECLTTVQHGGRRLKTHGYMPQQFKTSHFLMRHFLKKHSAVSQVLVFNYAKFIHELSFYLHIFFTVGLIISL